MIESWFVTGIVIITVIFYVGLLLAHRHAHRSVRRQDEALTLMMSAIAQRLQKEFEEELARKQNPFDCPDCGGSVEVRSFATGPITYRGIEIKPPAIHLPICSKCGEQWLDKEATDRLHTALENTYARKVKCSRD